MKVNENLTQEKRSEILNRAAALLDSLDMTSKKNVWEALTLYGFVFQNSSLNSFRYCYLSNVFHLNAFDEFPEDQSSGTEEHR